MVTVVVEIENNNKLVTHELEYKKEDLHIFNTLDKMLESLDIHRQIVVFDDTTDIEDGMYIQDYFKKYMNEI